MKHIVLRSCILIVCAMLHSGCSTASPEEAALRQLPSGMPSEIIESYSVAAVKDTSTGKFVVLAPAIPPADNSYPKLFYSFVEPGLFGWQAALNGSVYIEPTVDNTIITGQRFATAPANDVTPEVKDTGLDPFVIGRGSDLAEGVSAVEVSFDDGQTLRSEIVNDVYVVINPSADTPCKAVFFNAENQAVYEINWGENFGLSVPHSCSSNG